MNHHDEFDDLLHDALSEYREAEPLAGIEERVLQRMQSLREERRHAMWMWGAVATCAALLLAGVWLGAKNPTLPKEGGAEHAASPQVAAYESKELASVTKSPTRPEEGRMGHPESVTAPAEAPVEAPVAEAKARQTIQRAMTSRAATNVAEAKTSAVESRALPAQFPTPTPLTGEERAFMAALQNAPDSVLVAPDSDKTITIAEIEIRPLTEGGVSSSGTGEEQQ